MGSVSSEYQSLMPPLVGDQRMKGINGPSFQPCIAGFDPRLQKKPQGFIPDDGLRIVSGHQHDLPATSLPHDMDVGDGTLRIAILNGDVGQLDLPDHHRVDNEPGLVHAHVFHAAAHELADHRASTVASDYPAGAHIARLPGLCIANQYPGMLFAVFDALDLRV